MDLVCLSNFHHSIVENQMHEPPSKIEPKSSSDYPWRSNELTFEVSINDFSWIYNF